MGDGIFRLVGGTLALLAMMAVPSAAHHSFAMFDGEREIELAGTVREFQWANPHTWVQLDVTANGRSTMWSIEGRSPNVLARRGWNRLTLRPGDRVTLTVHPLKDGRPGGAIISVRFADGRVLNADTPTAVDTNEEGPR
ncbi:DUF6152 family protein [Alteraurantiacibacter buctensis]|uniref:Uncharacterized protein n=1 Tax=Alteraurantiacibacter buctensis TaxID=1503981 RepID=A0A844Z241_9SPHN|nr:DUF6152 family protein [Alteraurantiacibacter buctensis]MXO71973.1 hypothetical protein [Alteraurantiacibacter buctensis]